MSIYFCKDCKNAFMPEEATTDGKELYCKKCASQLVNLGAEDGRVSLRGHLQSQEAISKDELYHDYSLISSKHYTTQKKDPVLIDCESKLRINPINTEALFTLSQWYYSHGMASEAIAIAQQVLKIDKEHLAANEFIARLNSLGQSKQLPDALPTLEDMGLNLMKAKNYNDAEVVFKKILTLSPKHAAAQRYLAEIYTEKGAFSDVIHILNRLSLQFPKDPQILFNLAVACYNANDFPRALSNLKEAKKLSSDITFNAEVDRFIQHLDSL